ncbi:MAG: DUF3047 domain-containing protein, partial [Burkholderiales bacterium]
MSGNGIFLSDFSIAAAICGLPFLLASTQAHAQAAPQLSPFAPPGAAAPAPPWHFEGFADSVSKGATRFEIVDDGGIPALKLSADNAYGTLVHPWRGAAPGLLAWRWRLVSGVPTADIMTKAGDDSALKVCVMFDQPLDQMPLFERTTLRLARATSGKDLPAATVCYLWDAKYPKGTAGANPYTERLRFIVLRGPQDPLGPWFEEQRNVNDDFQK